MAKYHISQSDAFAYLRDMASESIDMVFTDIPYESLEKHRKIGTTTRLKNSKASSNNWFGVIENGRLEELMRELYRVLKRDTHCYMMCDAETMFHLKPAGELAGFKFWKPIVWDKQAIGMGYHYRARYEFVLFFEKGKRKLNDLGMPDVLVEKRIRNGYPTEKPQALIENFIKQSTQPNQVVLDPFYGSGSSLAAAVNLGRHGLGNDISETAYLHTSERLASVADIDNDLLQFEAQRSLIA